MSLLLALKEVGYRIGDIQVLQYDAARVDIFQPGYVSKLYFLGQSSGKRWLPNLFCGMANINHDAITCYLLQRPLLVLVNWKTDTTFEEIGFIFPVFFQPLLSIRAAERQCFGAYGFFRQYWGKPEAEVVGMLGLAYMFQEWGLKAIHGVSYDTNSLTRRFLKGYGFKQTGHIPYYQVRDGVLVNGVVTTLLRTDFEQYVESQLSTAIS